jgi:predicted dehydrogenase
VEVAIVGTGKVAEQNYIPALLQHDDVSISCYSRTQERLQAVADRFGVRAASSLDDLFERSPDTVFVLTGERERFDATLSILPYSPKRLFFEKPLVASQGQAQVSVQDFWDGKKLLEQAQSSGAEVAMVFNYRFFDQTQRARRLIEERDFGSPVGVVALSHYATWSHCIDLVLLLGGRLHEITGHQGGQARSHSASGEAADLAASFLLDSGAVGTIVGTNGIEWGYPLFELILAFERGRIHLRGLDQDMEVLDSAGQTHEIFRPSRETSRWDKYNASFDKSVAAYLDSIRRNEPPPVPGVAGLLELQFEASLQQSITDGASVVAGDLFPIDPVT